MDVTAAPGTIALVMPNQYSADRAEHVFRREIEEKLLMVLVVGPRNIRQGYQLLREAGVDAILARGGTYRDFFDLNGDIPLVEMRISMLDILDALRTAEDLSGAQIYLLLHDNVEFNATLCERFIHTPVVYQAFHGVEELQGLLDHTPPEVPVVGSGYVSEISKSRNLLFVDIFLRPDTMRIYYDQARALLRQTREEKTRLAQLQATLSHIEEGIIVLDGDGNLHSANQRGVAFLGTDGRAPEGLFIGLLLPAFPFVHLLGQEITVPKRQLIRVGDAELHLSIVSYTAYRSERFYLLTLQTVRDIQRREYDVRFKLAQRGLAAQHTFDDILTQDAGMGAMIRQAQRIAPKQGPILLIGESGTGKELFAQSIHNSSDRRGGPFVAVNCAALNESLLESELFGYVGGAFTGARKEGKTGLFELAHQGTIFLDEINSMPPGLQSKILRVLEEQKVMRIGSDYVIPLDIRLISAANQDLTEKVRAGSFRLDLYHRLNTFILRIPPLRERKDDIEPLFRAHLAREQEGKDLSLPPEFLAQLVSYDWPGNVRELRNAALRYAAFGGDNAAGEILRHEETRTPGPALTDTCGHIDLQALSHTVEDLVIQSLLNSGLGKTEIARLLGISRQALYQKLQRTRRVSTAL